MKNKQEKTVACTYFDRNYLVKGLAMCKSFRLNNPQIKLFVLCFDDYTEKVLKSCRIKDLITISTDKFEDKDLIKVKKNRSLVEYYWTCTPSLPLYILQKYPEFKKVLYLDADLYFFDSIEDAIDELGDGSILTVEHRYPNWQSFRNLRTGRFNVGFQIFTRKKESLDCLNRWRNQCLKWCYFRVEDGKMADQLYLNEWPKLYKGLVISKHLGLDVAPWNVLQYSIRQKSSNTFINNQKLICYHYHQLDILGVDTFRFTSGYFLSKRVKDFIYYPYIKSLKESIKDIKKIDKEFDIKEIKTSLISAVNFNIIKLIAPIYWLVQTLNVNIFHRDILKKFNEKVEEKEDLSLREAREIRHFDTMSSFYDQNYGYTKPFTKYKIDKKSQEFIEIIKQSDIGKNLVIIEMGCGTGEYTKRIAQKLPEVKIIGIDISKNILNIARQKCRNFKNVEFICKSAYKTGLKDKSVNIVCGFYALHHFDIAKISRESKRILKERGLVFFYEPNILNPVVFLIKSNKFLKSKVGDSPDEWAINPLTIKQQFPGLKVIRLSSSEFILPVGFIPLTILKFLDKLTSNLRFFPYLKYLGGSLEICFQKI